MWEDPIVAEVHRTREKLAAECNFDIEAFFADVRKRQASLGNRLVPQKKHAEPTAEADRGRHSGSPGVYVLRSGPGGLVRGGWRGCRWLDRMLQARDLVANLRRPRHRPRVLLAALQADGRGAAVGPHQRQEGARVPGEGADAQPVAASGDGGGDIDVFHSSSSRLSKVASSITPRVRRIVSVICVARSWMRRAAVGSRGLPWTESRMALSAGD